MVTRSIKRNSVRNYRKKARVFVGDFETTVYDGQETTEVWASAVVELGAEKVKIFHSIEDTLDYFCYLNCPLVVYYHNLKFDGSFWLDYLLRSEKFSPAYDEVAKKFSPVKDIEDNAFIYNVSEMGDWYSITLKVNGNVIEFRDSLKLLPFSVKKIGQSFGTKHKKLDMVYEGYRYAGCEITDAEKEYIANDVLVVKEALEIMFAQGHNKLTIGSCCLAEFKSIVGKGWYEEDFPDLTKIELDENVFGSKNADEYIRKSYRGGWCYLVKGKESRVYPHGITADVNSLYPSMMSSQSGNRYPVREPKFWKGDKIPEVALTDTHYYFVRFRCRFKIRKGFLPFVQIKNNAIYQGNKCLETSDMYDVRTGKYHPYYIDENGEKKKFEVLLTMTQTDFELFKKHYRVYDLKILDGCYFYAETGMFDEYMEKYKRIKMESEGALRELAKLFLNNLYGKMATNPKSNFKVAHLNPDTDALSFETITDSSKRPGFIPVGSAITSYARCFTITAAQKNYHGPDKPGFIYADTDSIHCDLKPEDLKGVPVHPTDFCHWKLESTWDMGYFVRQKTYIEHVIEKDLKPVEQAFYNIKCAGMPEKCKKLFLYSMTGTRPEDYESMTEEEKAFIAVKRDLTDFDYGLVVPSKLRPRRIKGGIILETTTYEMR